MMIRGLLIYVQFTLPMWNLVFACGKAVSLSFVIDVAVCRYFYRTIYRLLPYLVHSMPIAPFSLSFALPLHTKAAFFYSIFSTNSLNGGISFVIPWHCEYTLGKEIFQKQVTLLIYICIWRRWKCVSCSISFLIFLHSPIVDTMFFHVIFIENVSECIGFLMHCICCMRLSERLCECRNPWKCGN